MRTLACPCHFPASFLADPHSRRRSCSKDWDGVVNNTLQSFLQPTVRDVIRTGDIDGAIVVSSDKGDEIRSIASITQVRLGA